MFQFETISRFHFGKSHFDPKLNALHEGVVGVLLPFLFFNLVYLHFAKAQEFASEWVSAAQISIEIDQMNGRLRGSVLDQSEHTQLRSQIQQKNQELRAQLLKIHDQKIPLYEKPRTRRELQDRMAQARAEISRLNGDEKKLKPSERQSKYERLAELTQIIEADRKAMQTAPRSQTRSLASPALSDRLAPDGSSQTGQTSLTTREQALEDLPVLFEAEPTGAR